MCTAYFRINEQKIFEIWLLCMEDDFFSSESNKI